MNEIKVPFFKASITKAEEDAVLQVLRSGWLTTGKWAAEFEKKFSACVTSENDIQTVICSIRDNGIYADRLTTNELLPDPKDLVFYEVCMAKREEVFELPGAEKEEKGELKDPFKGKKKKEEPSDGQQELRLEGSVNETE